MAFIPKKIRAYQVLNTYSGPNTYIHKLKEYVAKKIIPDLNDLQIDFILNNQKVHPKEINKIIKLSPWYQDKKKIEWELEFQPEKIKILEYYGKTMSTYVCKAQYRQSVAPQVMYLSKNGIINDFLSDNYENYHVDFTPFNERLKSINPQWSLMPHQEKAVKFLLSRKKCILSLDMGLGKTMSSIVASLVLDNKKVLVICPASLKENWKNEISRFINPDKVSVIKGLNDLKKNELVEFLGLKTDNGLKKEALLSMAKEKGKWHEGKQFTILNFDIIQDFHQLPKSRKKNDIQEAFDNSDLLNARFDIIIVDEAHKLSENTSNRFKIMRNYIRNAQNEYTWLLTGTMLTNNVKNFYNMLSLIENDITHDYNHFVKEYCGAKQILMKGEWERLWFIWNKGRYASYASMNYKAKAVFREYVNENGKKITLTNEATNLDELKERISHLYLKMDKEEIILNVKKYIHPIAYQLNTFQREEYDKLWEEYEKDSDNASINEVKQLVEISLYRQYISKLMMYNTIKLTEDFLSKGEKVFIVCSYDDEVYGLKDYFGNKAVIFNGKITPKAKEKAVEEFNENDDVKVFIGQIVACGVGINLNKSCHIAVFQNLHFTDAAFTQACDRIFRIGSTQDAHIYLQYYKDTIYERMVEVMKNKKEIADTVFLREEEK